MASNRYQFEPLGQQHDRAAFASGSDALDTYFRRQAGQDARRRVAAVFVLADRETRRVVGYFTLSATGILLADIPPAVASKLPRYPHLPAVLLGRLAVSLGYQGQGFGRRLLIDALRRSYEQRDIGAIAVVVDAKDDVARRFSELYGFERFPGNEYRLYLRMTTIADLLP